MLLNSFEDVTSKFLCDRIISVIYRFKGLGCYMQQQEEVLSQGDLTRFESAATCNATAKLPKQQPFATFIPHRCPVMIWK